MEVPRGKVYEGPSGIGRDSHWLTSEDLIEGRDVDVKIEAVILYPEVTFQGGRKKENVLGLKFSGKERVLGLNATNRKALNKMFGNMAKGWRGQTITLYVTETQMAGETVKCVRIRNRGSRSATAAEQFLHEDGGRSKARVGNGAMPAIDLTGADEGGGSLFGDGGETAAVGAEGPKEGAMASAGSTASPPEAPAPPPSESTTSTPAPLFDAPSLFGAGPLPVKEDWLSAMKAKESKRIGEKGGTLGEQMKALTARMVELSAEYDREAEHRAQMEVQK